MRLSPAFRLALYAAFCELFATGAGWLLADQLKDRTGDDLWPEIAAALLMLHGGGAMAILMLLGALVPLHVRRAWRSGRNRTTGTAMVTFNAVLIATAFALYYLGAETLRLSAAGLHIGAGLLLPMLFVVHVVVGRRSARSNGRRSPS